MVKLLKIKRRDFLSIRQHSYFGVSNCENLEVQINNCCIFEIKHAIETCGKIYFLFIFNLV